MNSRADTALQLGLPRALVLCMNTDRNEERTTVETLALSGASWTELVAFATRECERTYPIEGDAREGVATRTVRA